MSGVSISKDRVLELKRALDALIQNEAITRARVDMLEHLANKPTLKMRLKWLLTGR